MAGGTKEGSGAQSYRTFFGYFRFTIFLSVKWEPLQGFEQRSGKA